MPNILAKFGWTSSSAMIRGVCQIIQLVIMTRTLTPTEIGIFAIISIIIGFSQVFSDAGLSQAVIYFTKIDKVSLSEIYLFNVFMGGGISCVVIFLSSFISDYFDEPLIFKYLILVSPIFFIRSIGQQSSALIQKKLNFSLLAKIESLTSVVGLIVFLILIYFDFGVISMILSQLVVTSTMTISLKLSEKTSFPETFGFNWKKNRMIYTYGLYQSLESILNYFSSQFDQFLLGAKLGVDLLGIYSSIKELVFKPAFLFVNPIFNKVSFPMMAQSKSAELKTIYFWIIKSLGLILIPFYAVVFLYPSEILSFVYGPSWGEYSDILKLLAIYMFLLSMINPSGSLLKATGKVKLGFYWNLFCSILRPLVMYASLQFGLEVMLYSLIIYQAVVLIFHCFILVKPNSNLSFFGYLLALSPSFIIILICSSIVQWVSSDYYIIDWFFQVLMMAISYVFILVIYIFSMVKVRVFL